MVSVNALRIGAICLGIFAAHFVFNNVSHAKRAVFLWLGYTATHFLFRSIQALLFLGVGRTLGQIADEHPRGGDVPDAAFPLLSLVGALALVASVLMLDHYPWAWARSELAFVALGVGAGPWLVRFIGYDEWSDSVFRLTSLLVTFGILILFDVRDVYWISVRFFRMLYIASFFAIGAGHFAWYFRLGVATDVRR